MKWPVTVFQSSGRKNLLNIGITNYQIYQYRIYKYATKIFVDLQNFQPKHQELIWPTLSNKLHRIWKMSLYTMKMFARFLNIETSGTTVVFRPKSLQFSDIGSFVDPARISSTLKYCWSGSEKFQNGKNNGNLRDYPKAFPCHRLKSKCRNRN